MKTFIVILFLFVSNVQANFENVFPIPISIVNDDENFSRCPEENFVSLHSKNCSLFHFCGSEFHLVFSCIDEFYFDPKSQKCRHWPNKHRIDCDEIVEHFKRNRFEALDSEDFRLESHRKSASSPCEQLGIHPDTLDCSLFHYCRSNNEHEIFRCPNRLNFDPKTLLCAPIPMVDCQYEPTRRRFDVDFQENDDQSSKETSDIQSIQNVPENLCQNQGRCTEKQTDPKEVEIVRNEFDSNEKLRVIVTEQTETKLNKPRINDLFHHLNSKKQTGSSESLSYIYMILFFFVSLTMMVSVGFLCIICFRMILSDRKETVGQWKTLPDPTSV